MVKFLKPNKAVVMLNGRFASRKGVIINASTIKVSVSLSKEDSKHALDESHT